MALKMLWQVQNVAKFVKMPKAIEMLPNLISKKFEEVPGSKVSGSKIVELKKNLW